MNKKLRFYTIIGVIFVSIVGSILHFAYDFLGQNFFVGLFTPTSESTWEHMKLFFFSNLLYVPIFYYALKQKYPCALTASLSGVLAGTFIIPVLFYTYSGILGFNTAIIDILIFYFGAFVSLITANKLSKDNSVCTYSLTIILAVIVLAFLFLIFSYNPPNLGIFAEP